MPIINSIILSQSPQADSRVYITEQHTYASGATQCFEYLADSTLDFQAIATERAANINAELARKELQRLEAANFIAPITVRAFLEKIPADKRLLLRELAKTVPELNDALEYLKAGDEVFKHAAEVWLNKLVLSGLFSTAEVSDILSNW